MVIIKIHHNPQWNLQSKVEETVELLARDTWHLDPKEAITLYFQSIHQGVYGEIKFINQEPIRNQNWTEYFAKTLLIDRLTVEYSNGNTYSVND